MTDLLWIFLYKRIKDKSHRSKNFIFHARFFNILRIFFKNYFLLDPLTFNSNKLLIDRACSSALRNLFDFTFFFPEFLLLSSIKGIWSDLLSLTKKYIFSKFIYHKTVEINPLTYRSYRLWISPFYFLLTLFRINSTFVVKIGYSTFTSISNN